MIKKILLVLCVVGSVFAQSGYNWVNYRHRNPQTGGWVSYGSSIDEDVFIAPTAKVLNSASITGKSKIYGNAVIKDEAIVENRARIYGNAIVGGEAIVSGNAKISGHANISGDCIIKGDVIIKGYTTLTKGTYTKGVINHPKPQSLINAENSARIAEKNRLARLKASSDAAIAKTTEYNKYMNTESQLQSLCNKFTRHHSNTDIRQYNNRGHTYYLKTITTYTQKIKTSGQYGFLGYHFYCKAKIYQSTNGRHGKYKLNRSVNAQNESSDKAVKVSEITSTAVNYHGLDNYRVVVKFATGHTVTLRFKSLNDANNAEALIKSMKYQYVNRKYN